MFSSAPDRVLSSCGRSGLFPQTHRKGRKPVSEITLKTWVCALNNWLYPEVGDVPLADVNNLAVKLLVAKLVKSDKLGPKSVNEYTN
jgi:hypothetical protein